MSALEEYNRFMDGVFDGPDGRCAWIPGRNYIMPNGPIPVARYHEVVTKADAAITELEAALSAANDHIADLGKKVARK